MTEDNAKVETMRITITREEAQATLAAGRFFGPNHQKWLDKVLSDPEFEYLTMSITTDFSRSDDIFGELLELEAAQDIGRNPGRAGTMQIHTDLHAAGDYGGPTVPPVGSDTVGTVECYVSPAPMSEFGDGCSRVVFAIRRHEETREIIGIDTRIQQPRSHPLAVAAFFEMFHELDFVGQDGRT